MLGGEGQACRSTPSIRPPSGWIGWVVSVVVASTIINVAWDFIPALFTSVVKPVAPSVTRSQPTPFLPHQTTTLPSSASFRSRVNTDPILVETTLRRLAKRQDACAGSNAGTSSDYNMPLHVGALFIILSVSSLACALPMLASKFPVLRIPKPFFFGVRHFGTGVLLATAFVHLLPTAFISLGNPCLSNFWTTDYPAMPGAIALAGIFFVSIIEMIFSPARSFTPRTPQAGGSGSGPRARRSSMTGGHCGYASDVAAAITRHPTNTRRLSIEPAPLQETQGNPANASKETLESQSGGLTEEQLHKKSILQCMLLEVGILFHSVFIGMALSVAIGGDFVVLLIAIAFHRTRSPLDISRPSRRQLTPHDRNIRGPRPRRSHRLHHLAQRHRPALADGCGIWMHVSTNPPPLPSQPTGNLHLIKTDARAQNSHRPGNRPCHAHPLQPKLGIRPDPGRHDERRVVWTAGICRAD